MIRIWTLFFAVGIILIEGCSSPSTTVIQSHVKPGMTTTDLRLNFGKPNRIASHADGGQDWFYNFGDQHEETEDSTEEKSTENKHWWRWSRTRTKTISRSEQAIHISPEGMVLPPVPTGRIIVEY